MKRKYFKFIFLGVIVLLCNGSFVQAQSTGDSSSFQIAQLSEENRQQEDLMQRVRDSLRNFRDSQKKMKAKARENKRLLRENRAKARAAQAQLKRQQRDNRAKAKEVQAKAKRQRQDQKAKRKEASAQQKAKMRAIREQMRR